MENGFLDTPEVHDNFVLNVIIDLENRVICLETEYRDGKPPESPRELTDLYFVDVAAHHFDYCSGPSILFDIESVSVESLLKEWQTLFERGLKYGWPLTSVETMDELVNQFVKDRLRGFRIRGGVGLDGFIIAAEVNWHQPS